LRTAFVPVLLVCASTAGAPALKHPKPKGGELVGGWVRVEATGNVFPLPDRFPVYVTFTADGRYVRRHADDPPHPERVWSVDPKATPAALDIRHATGTDAQLFVAIYKVEGDTLTICGQHGGGRPRPTEFAAPKGTTFSLQVYKRVKPKD